MQPIGSGPAAASTPAMPAPQADRGPPCLSIDDCRRLTTDFLRGPMREALTAVDYALPDWDALDCAPDLRTASRATVAMRHVPGASDADYRVAAFGETLRMRLQLNVWRFVIVYSIPAGGLVDVTGVAPRFARWERGAVHAGWTVGWRDATAVDAPAQRLVETYCYAMLDRDFLVDPMAQLYWRTDIVQMTRGFMLEARRGAVPLSG